MSFQVAGTAEPLVANLEEETQLKKLCQMLKVASVICLGIQVTQSASTSVSHLTFMWLLPSVD